MNFPRPHLLYLLSCLLSTPLFSQAEESSILSPNEHLTVQGIPPIETSMAEKLAPYNDFRPRTLLDWHPKSRSILLSTRSKGATAQLHLLNKPFGPLQQITDFPDPVRNAKFQPSHGKFIVFEKDSGGNEANQLYRLDLADHKITLLSDTNEKHASGPWDHAGKRLIMVSTPLDKTAKNASRAEVFSQVYLLDPLHPEKKQKILALPGGGWGDFQWSPDDKQLLAINRKSINNSSVWLINLASGEHKQILPAPGNKEGEEISYNNPVFNEDGKSIFINSDSAGEFMQLMQIQLADLSSKVLSADIAWNVEELELSTRSQFLASVVNQDGLAQLRLFDAKHGKALKQPELPIGAVSHLKWRGLQEVGFSLNSAQSPGEIYSLNLKTGKLQEWTKPDPETLNTEKFRSAEIIRWKSFDQRSISGLIARPPAQNSAGKKFTGPRPVLILIHGGPEGQAKIGFLNRYNYWVNELGITLIQPNVRGSNGYGKSFLKLDNGMKREDSVKDIGALLDWITTQPDLDAKKVAVMGGSYGGYMSLASATHFADRIVGAIDVVGISHYVTFLERTESYRRDLRRVEYGDERDPEMRAFLEKIAPLNNANKISKPLFVIQGKNDPRVPLAEAEQIVARVRENKVPVWYLMADNEGHGFARKPNQDYYFFSVTRFLQEYLLK